MEYQPINVESDKRFINLIIGSTNAEQKDKE
jgi:hypothetical protein